MKSTMRIQGVEMGVLPYRVHVSAGHNVFIVYALLGVDIREMVASLGITSVTLSGEMKDKEKLLAVLSTMHGVTVYWMD